MQVIRHSGQNNKEEGSNAGSIYDDNTMVPRLLLLSALASWARERLGSSSRHTYHACTLLRPSRYIMHHDSYISPWYLRLNHPGIPSSEVLTSAGHAFLLIPSNV